MPNLKPVLEQFVMFIIVARFRIVDPRGFWPGFFGQWSFYLRTSLVQHALEFQDSSVATENEGVDLECCLVMDIMGALNNRAAELELDKMHREIITASEISNKYIRLIHFVWC